MRSSTLLVAVLALLLLVALAHPGVASEKPGRQRGGRGGRTGNGNGDSTRGGTAGGRSGGGGTSGGKGSAGRVSGGGRSGGGRSGGGRSGGGRSGGGRSGGGSKPDTQTGEGAKSGSRGNGNGRTGGGSRGGRGRNRNPPPEVPPEDAPQDAPQDQQTSKPRSGGGSFPVLPANEIARGNLPKGLLTPLALKPITDFYADESSLGKGHYGSVSKVGLIGSVEARQPAIFALKTLNYFQKTNDGDIIPNSENRFAGDNEDELFLKINGGPFVVRSYGSWKETDPEDPIKTVKKTVYGLASGDLTKHLKDLSFDDTRQTFARIVYGLAFLHTNGIVHKDLKAANILVGFDGMPRIGDFGSATFRRNLVAGTGKNKFCVYTGSGDGAVRAPEVSVVFNRLHLAQRAAIRGGNEEEWLEEAAETDCATESADIFALGVILYQMVTGGQSGECRVGEYAGLHLPHIKGNKVCGLVDWDRMLEDISEKQDTSFLDLTNLSPSPKFKYPKDLQNARDLITRLMHPDPRRRLGASTLQGPRPRKGWVTDTLKILEHPFFSAPVHPDLKPITLQDLRAAGEAAAKVDSMPLQFLPGELANLARASGQQLERILAGAQADKDPRFNRFSNFQKVRQPDVFVNGKEENDADDEDSSFIDDDSSGEGAVFQAGYKKTGQDTGSSQQGGQQDGGSEQGDAGDGELPKNYIDANLPADDEDNSFSSEDD